MNADAGLRHRLRATVAVGVVLAACTTARAQDIPGYPNIQAMDPRETALLPGYCTYTQTFRERLPGGNDKAMIDGWYAKLGPSFNAMHHYCWGLMKTNRAVLLARDPAVRRFYLNDAITEYDYVITRVPDDFVLLPEMLTKKAENLVRLGKGSVAVYEFERAIELKRDYWPPYAYLSDYYKEAGDKKRAREVLETGLQQVPGSQSLRSRLAELDSVSKPKNAAR
jgi:hypothetical protein